MATPEQTTFQTATREKLKQSMSYLNIGRRPMSYQSIFTKQNLTPAQIENERLHLISLITLINSKETRYVVTAENLREIAKVSKTNSMALFNDQEREMYCSIIDKCINEAKNGKTYVILDVIKYLPSIIETTLTRKGFEIKEVVVKHVERYEDGDCMCGLMGIEIGEGCETGIKIEF